jgi:hypothetical protein
VFQGAKWGTGSDNTSHSFVGLASGLCTTPLAPVPLKASASPEVVASMEALQPAVVQAQFGDIKTQEELFGTIFCVTEDNMSPLGMQVASGESMSMYGNKGVPGASSNAEVLSPATQQLSALYANANRRCAAVFPVGNSSRVAMTRWDLPMGFASGRGMWINAAHVDGNMDSVISDLAVGGFSISNGGGRRQAPSQLEVRFVLLCCV